MKVALIGDSLWLTHEALLLRHLVFGLSDEFVKTVPVFPQDSGPDEMPGVTERLTYRRSRLEWMTEHRIRRLAGRLASLDLDLIHLLGGRHAPSAAALARRLHLPMVANCWSPEQVRDVRSATDDQAMLILPTPSMVGPVGNAPHGIVRPGVLRRENVSPPLTHPEQALCLLVVVEGRIAKALPALMEGLARARPELPQLQVFLYPIGADAHKAWMTASKLNLLSQISMVGPEVGTHELLMQVDAVIQPQPIHRVWTLTLAAMAAARPVIAALSPDADYMIPGNTYEQISAANDPTAWADVLTALPRRADQYASLGRSARKYVQEHHGIGRYVSEVLSIYKQATGEPIKFNAAT